MRVMPVILSMRDSYEDLLHQTGIPLVLLDMRVGHADEELRKLLLKTRSERFIWVVYRADE